MMSGVGCDVGKIVMRKVIISISILCPGPIFGMGGYGMVVWYGMVCYGTVWYGIVCYGMVWLWYVEGSGEMSLASQTQEICCPQFVTLWRGHIFVRNVFVALISHITYRSIPYSTL